MRLRRAIWLVVAILAAVSIGSAGAEVVQRGGLRVTFDASFSPRTLPRDGAAPVGVTLGGRVTVPDGTDPPQLRRVEIAVNRHARLNYRHLPACRVEQIQPSNTASALDACRASLVGTGRFSARVLLPEQAPFPSDGEVLAFNGRYDGGPAILAHVYGTEPIPTSYTLPFRISAGKGDFGTVLAAALPGVTTDWGYITGFSMTLDRTYRRKGRAQGYVSAGCPAPEGFAAVPAFPLVRTTFAFAGGLRLSSPLIRSCRARG